MLLDAARAEVEGRTLARALRSHTEPSSVRTDGDVAAEVGAEDGVAAEAVEYVRRRMPKAVALLDRDHVDERGHRGNEAAGA